MHDSRKQTGIEYKAEGVAVELVAEVAIAGGSRRGDDRYPLCGFRNFKLFVECEYAFLVQPVQNLLSFAGQIPQCVGRINVDNGERIAVKFVESYRHLYQHFDSGNECLSCFAFEISSEPCECACPYNASCLGDERVSGRIFLYEFQIAVSAAVGTHVARFGLYPICIGQAGFDAPPYQRVELDQ